MGDIAAAAHGPAAETREKFNERIAGNKIFGLDGEEKIKQNIAVREHHAESKQYAVNSP